MTGDPWNVGAALFRGSGDSNRGNSPIVFSLAELTVVHIFNSSLMFFVECHPCPPTHTQRLCSLCYTGVLHQAYSLTLTSACIPAHSQFQWAPALLSGNCYDKDTLSGEDIWWSNYRRTPRPCAGRLPGHSGMHLSQCLGCWGRRTVALMLD